MCIHLFITEEGVVYNFKLMSFDIFAKMWSILTVTKLMASYFELLREEHDLLWEPIFC